MRMFVWLIDNESKKIQDEEYNLNTMNNLAYITEWHPTMSYNFSV